MTIRPSDLSPAARKKLGLDESGKPKKPPKKAGSEAFNGWCGYCWEPVTSGPAMDRHRSATGHSRFSCLAPSNLESDGVTK